MAKITKSGPSFSDDELQDPYLPQVVQDNLPTNEDRPVPHVARFAYGDESEGGDKSSDGSNLSQSSGDETSSNRMEKGTPREPAQDAGNPSDQSTEEQNDGVLSTDGDIQGTEEEFVDDDDIPPYSEWSYRELQSECKTRELVATGSHEDLVARLQEHDEEHAGE